jgi:peptide deformylase
VPQNNLKDAKEIDFARNPYKARIIKDASDKRLHIVAKKVKEPHSNETFAIIDAMKHVLKDANAVGLAAVQIGINRNIIIVWNDITSSIDEFINVEILEAHETDDNMYWAVEGCLSHPGLYAEVARCRHIVFKAQRLQDSKPQIFKASGMIARIIQHEDDHNLGILFTDKGLRMRNPTFDAVGQMTLMGAIREKEEHGQKDFKVD